MYNSDGEAKKEIESYSCLVSQNSKKKQKIKKHKTNIF